MINGRGKEESSAYLLFTQYHYKLDKEQTFFRPLGNLYISPKLMSLKYRYQGSIQQIRGRVLGINLEPNPTAKCQWFCGEMNFKSVSKQNKGLLHKSFLPFWTLFFV